MEHYYSLHMGCNGTPPKAFLVKGNKYIYWIEVDSDIFEEMLKLFQVKNGDKRKLEERIVEYVRDGIAHVEINSQDIFFSLRYNKFFSGRIIPGSWNYTGQIEVEK
ncbi:MAG: hypothetical protein ACXVLQ_18080 [Bacteriovorax sp.]